MLSVVCHSLRGMKVPIYRLKLLHDSSSAIQRSAYYSTCFGSWKSKLLDDRDLKISQQQTRNVGFFKKFSGMDLWKSSVGVSNAGIRRGRGRKINASLIKDLNKGQVIGCGEINMLWPGLNAPVYRGSEKVEQRRLPVDTNRMANIIQIRDKKTRGQRRLHPLDRGFTSSKIDGTLIPPFKQSGKYDVTVRPFLENFKAYVLHTRITKRMVGRLGRNQMWNVLVAVGNGNGVIGVGRGRKKSKYSAVLAARTRAQQKLVYIERHNTSVMHDFFARFGRSKVEVRKQPEGQGIKCQRVLKIMCKLVGIKDLYCKLHGTSNIDQNVKAFLLGLINQKSHQTIADEIGLNIVELDPARHNFPKVVASPEKSVEKKTFEHESMCDFSHYSMGNKLVLKKPPRRPFYTRTKGWQNYLLKHEKVRNQDEVKRRLKIKYGKVQSFLTSEFPEAEEFVRLKKVKPGSRWDPILPEH